MDNAIGQLEEKARELRRVVLEMCVKAGKGHVTSCMSCLDILVALYHGKTLRHDPKKPSWEERDRLILSKGQASPALYATLADVGFFDRKDLESFTKLNGKFACHLQKTVPGVELTVGALGHGFGVAAGIALAAKKNRHLFNVYAILGDGECYEGSIWETAMFAGHNNLNNLVTIVDRNHACTTDFTENLLTLEPFADKWKAFGFNVVEIDGHSMKDLLDTFTSLRYRPSQKPTVLIANTIKGKGVEQLSYDPLWHGRAPQGALAEECMTRLKC